MVCMTRKRFWTALLGGAVLPLAGTIPAATKIIESVHYDAILEDSKVGADLVNEGGWNMLVSTLRALQAQGFSMIRSGDGSLTPIKDIINFIPRVTERFSHG